MSGANIVEGVFLVRGPDSISCLTFKVTATNKSQSTGWRRGRILSHNLVSVFRGEFRQGVGGDTEHFLKKKQNMSENCQAVKNLAIL